MSFLLDHEPGGFVESGGFGLKVDSDFGTDRYYVLYQKVMAFYTDAKEDEVAGYDWISKEELSD